jgi:hypothetical protein
VARSGGRAPSSTEKCKRPQCAQCHGKNKGEVALNQTHLMARRPCPRTRPSRSWRGRHPCPSTAAAVWSTRTELPHMRGAGHATGTLYALRCVARVLCLELGICVVGSCCSWPPRPATKRSTASPRMAWHVFAKMPVKNKNKLRDHLGSATVGTISNLSGVFGDDPNSMSSMQLSDTFWELPMEMP